MIPFTGSVENRQIYRDKKNTFVITKVWRVERGYFEGVRIPPEVTRMF